MSAAQLFHEGFIMVKYGIRRLGEKRPVTFAVHKLEDTVGHLGYELSITYFVNDPIWLASTREDAESVLNDPPKRMRDSDYRNPIHNLDPSQYEVIEVKLEFP